MSKESKLQAKCEGRLNLSLSDLITNLRVIISRFINTPMNFTFLFVNQPE